MDMPTRLKRWKMASKPTRDGQADPASITNHGLYVGTGGAVKGWGTFVGDAVAKGGTLSPHKTGGLMTFSNALTLEGTLHLRLNRNNSPPNLVAALSRTGYAAGGSCGSRMWGIRSKHATGSTSWSSAPWRGGFNRSCCRRWPLDCCGI